MNSRKAFLSLILLGLASCSPRPSTQLPMSRDEAEQAVDSIAADDSVATVVPEVVDRTSITLALVGDILMGTDFREVELPPDSGRLLFAACVSLLRTADLAIGNLEGPIATIHQTEKSGRNSYAFEMPPYLAPRLREAGFDALFLGNNHAMDMGPVGSEQTCRYLQQLGIAYTGLLGQQPIILERHGLRIGICGFGQNSYSPLHTDTALVRRTVGALRSRCDLLIVTFHGGAEGTSALHVPAGTEYAFGENRGNLRQFAHLAIDCGADLVFGHGPHVPRAMELYEGHLIAYSLGNFCTPFGMSLTAQCGVAPLLRVRVNNKGMLLDGQIYSFRQHRPYGPLQDSTLEAARLIRSLSLQDFPRSPLKISTDGTISPK